MGRKARGRVKILVSVTPEESTAISTFSEVGETRSDFVRAAIRREIEARTSDDEIEDDPDA